MTDRDAAPGPIPREPDPASPAPPPAPPPLVTWEVPPSPPVAPVVQWEPPGASGPPPLAPSGVGGYAGGPPPFTIGALLSDSFARYGADPVRFFVLSAVATALSFLGSFLSMPFGASPFGLAADSSGLVGLLSFVVGIVTGSATFALAEGGPAMPFGRVLRRGVERSGWLFLTSLLLGIGAFVVLLVAMIPILVLSFLSPTAAALAFIPVFVVFVWLGSRVALALPANVADNLNSIDGLKVSWRVAKPRGVWLRILGAGLLIGLLFMPAAAGASLLLFLAMFGGQALLLLVISLLFAFFTPLSSLLGYSAYRRLVPPIEPSWTGPASIPPAAVDAAPPVAAAAPPPAPVESAPADAAAPTEAMAVEAPAAVSAAEVPPSIAAPAEPAPPLAPASPAASARPFRAPPFDLAAKAILALVVALDVAGVAAVPYVIGEFVSGRVTLPQFPTSPDAPFPGFPGGSGFVPPGTVAFGTSADIETCSVTGQQFVLSASDPIVWVAAFEHSLGLGDEVIVRVSLDGQEISSTTWGPATGPCIGVEQPEPSMVPGIYFYEVLVNGRLEATGTLFVQ